VPADFGAVRGEGRARPCGRLLGLWIPLDSLPSCALVSVPTHQIRGRGRDGAGVTLWWPEVIERQAYCWWSTEPEGTVEGCARSLTCPKVNPRAFALAARLGCPDLADRLGLHGDVLVTGLTPDNLPADLPAPVVAAAGRTWPLPALCQRIRRRDVRVSAHQVGDLQDPDLLRRVVAGLRRLG
jgi:hypothetical protein